MVFPPRVLRCIDALEQAGFACYAVGGCVRDALLGLFPQDYDLCTNARPEQIKTVFSGDQVVLTGEKHGTVGVVTGEGVVEITTFRTEGDYADRRHPDWVQFEDEITADLSRRDFTINAMACSPTRPLADPFGGQADLRSGILRTVGAPDRRFEEDALRILRGVRFAVRYRLHVEDATFRAMCAQAARMEALAPERVFLELCKLLPLVSAADLLEFSPIFAQAVPELRPTIGFDQHSPHHGYPLYTHIAHVTQAVPPTLPLRWAALLHDIGKVPTCCLDENGRGHFRNHAAVSAEMSDAVLRRLRAPNALREQVVFLVKHHMDPLEADRQKLRRRLSRWGEESLRQLLALQRADAGSKGVPADLSEFDRAEAALSDILAEGACLTVGQLAVDGYDMMALGLQGRQIGDALRFLLEQVLAERIPNEKSALTAALRKEKSFWR